MADIDDKLGGQALFNGFERLLLFPDTDLESIATMPTEELNEELRKLGLDPDEPLPDRIIQLISRGKSNITRRDDIRSSVRQPGSGINIFIDDDPPITGARIKVIGVGGGGGNAV